MLKKILLFLTATTFCSFRAERYYCIRDTSIKVVLKDDIFSSSSNQLSLCSYVRGEKSSTNNLCIWEIKADNSIETLAIEVENTDSHLRTASASLDSDRSIFAGVVDIFTNDESGKEIKLAWNFSQNFQLVSLQKGSVSVVIELRVDNATKAYLADQFYTKVSYSSFNSCSTGLEHHNGRCYTVKYTDKLSQSEFAFASDLDVTQVLESLSREQGLTAVQQQPVRLAAAFCNATRSLLHWDPGRAVCGQLKIGANFSIGVGSGDCVIVRLDQKLLAPIPCDSNPMPTLLSFPTTLAKTGEAVHAQTSSNCWKADCPDASGSRKKSESAFASLPAIFLIPISIIAGIAGIIAIWTCYKLFYEKKQKQIGWPIEQSGHG